MLFEGAMLSEGGVFLEIGVSGELFEYFVSGETGKLFESRFAARPIIHLSIQYASEPLQTGVTCAGDLQNSFII